MPITSHPSEVGNSNEDERAERATAERDPVPAPDVTEDPVTEASWESFPASDPPAWIASDHHDD
jgi:hypothetical protein